MYQTIKAPIDAADLYSQGIIAGLGEAAVRHGHKIIRAEVLKSRRVGAVITVDLERTDGGYTPPSDAVLIAKDLLVDQRADEPCATKLHTQWRRWIAFTGFCPEDLTHITVRFCADDWADDQINALVNTIPTQRTP